jgi:peroxiredoxin
LAWSLLLVSVENRPIAPPISVQTSTFGDGSIFDLSNEKGNVVVLFFMAGWCATCFPEARALAQLHADYADRGVRILAVDVDQNETEKELANFRENAENGEYLWAMDRQNRIVRAYGVKALDTTIIVDKQGRAAYADGVPSTYERLASVVEALLQQ